MITRDEIINMSEELEVHPSNVERDYVFGWVLSGIYRASKLGDHLVLKGGNCFRKAYFEKTRYSSDLDFAATGRLTNEFIKGELVSVCEFVESQSGVKFDNTRARVEDKRSADSTKHIHEARLYFKDFFGEEGQVIISIRLDISDLEKIILPVQTRNLIHPYSDLSSCSTQIKCLKLEEMLASKLKCLIQRRHSADLFDFVNATFFSPVIDIDQKEIVSAFLAMTIFGRGPRIVKDLFFNLPFDAIKLLWAEYIACPRSSIIDFGKAVDGFKSVIDSLFGSFPSMHGEHAFFPAELRNPIMEAGYKMTTLQVVYQEVEREVEPYALKYKIRKDGVGQEYLYAFDLTGGRTSGPGLKSFLHSGFLSISNTENRFDPRCEVELSKAGQAVGDIYFHGKPRTWRMGYTKTPKHTYECPLCSKYFYRNTFSPKLNPHKDKFGNSCFGRMGILIN
jgi:predicted nucleotidyltransferase component of viral defense system